MGRRADRVVAEGLHDETWLQTNTVGWPQFLDRLQDYPPERVAAITDVPQQQIIEMARLYATTRPSLIKIADGVQRNLTGGQNVRLSAPCRRWWGSTVNAAADWPTTPPITSSGMTAWSTVGRVARRRAGSST